MTAYRIKATVLSLILFLSLNIGLQAGEGMWLPLLLGQLNETEMQSLGMKMTAEDIYSVNKGSLKDAIVHFGGFCTGEVISSEGLVLTNHHCGYGQIQRHSSLENNYLRDGFWAKDHSKELANPGLFVTFISRIEDISEQALDGVNDNLSASERQSVIDKNLAQIKSDVSIEEYQDIVIRPFFHGNQYFLFVTETYNDIRLVGTPPSSIGKFGADTDNWVWPRHTGDFSLFRIYASPDGKPAEYSEDNIPFKPRHHLPVSMDGVSADDFTLIFGFPGRTDEYLPAVAMDQRVNKLNPIRIGIREKSLAILDQAMRANPEARIQYASKQARIANSWKKWIGESLGVEATDGIGKRKMTEAEFTTNIKTGDFPKSYKSILPKFNRLYDKVEPFAESRDYVNEIVYRNVELFRLTSTMKRFANIYQNNGMEALKQRLGALEGYLNTYYKDYSIEIDQKIAESLLGVYFDQVRPKHQAKSALVALKDANGNVSTLTNKLFEGSILTKGDDVLSALKKDPENFFKNIESDPAYRFIQDLLSDASEDIFANYDTVNKDIQILQREYMDALMKVFPDRKFYPDANSTMRVTYGQVQGYQAEDTLDFHHITYLDGMIEKFVPGDYEFDLPAQLLELYENKDFGPYATADGKVPVCFIGSNHTTGGNSGSPAIDAYGNLIGLNFDRSWHGTMSDINYDPSICRNIMVDARYILFIIDKFAGATHIIDELTLVHPKMEKE